MRSISFVCLLVAALFVLPLAGCQNMVAKHGMDDLANSMRVQASTNDQLVKKAEVQGYQIAKLKIHAAQTQPAPEPASLAALLEFANSETWLIGQARQQERAMRLQGTALQGLAALQGSGYLLFKHTDAEAVAAIQNWKDAYSQAQHEIAAASQPAASQPSP